MTELRKNLIEIFQKLSEIETMKDRFYPAKAFKSVANDLMNSDSYIITEDRVIIKNSITKFSRILGASSSAIFIEYLNHKTCSRLDSEPFYNSDLDNITGIGPTKKTILINAGINNSNDLMKLNLNIGDTIPGTNLSFTQQMHTGLILWNRTHGERIDLKLANEYINDFKNKITNNIYVLGSYRRLKSTIGDIDIVIPKTYIDYSSKIINWLDEVLVHGESKIAGIKDKTQIDIRIIDKPYLGAHILHGTGSQEFNIKLRALAKSKGLKLNEYGIEDELGVFHTFDTENEIFDYLGIEYVPPEMR